MFGIWRTLLALEVVAFHLLFVPFIGAYAVFSFFVLSGFLMTAIMQRTYGYSAGGFARYLGNRALRLYPSYWFALAISVAIVTVLGDAQTLLYHPVVAMPASTRQWLENLSMLFLDLVPRDAWPRLVPLAWALTVEVIFYILIGIGISRTKRTTLIWCIASIAYVVVVSGWQHPRDAANELIPMYLYSAVPAGSLPFSCGALAWHYRADVQGVLARLHLGDARILIAARWAVYFGIAITQSLSGWTGLVMAGNWFNIGLSALIVCALYHVRPADRLAQIDKAIGDFSYPIYLLHLQMGIVAAALLFGGPAIGRSWRSAAVVGLALMLTIVVGAICARVIDPAVERLRARIKPRVGLSTRTL